MADAIRVTVWGEFRHEKSHEAVRKVYPKGMHTVIAKGLNACEGIKAKTATLDEPEHGLTEAVAEEDGRPHLVGAHGPSRSEGRDRDAGPAAGARGHGADRASLRPLLQDLPEAHGDHVQSDVAGARAEDGAALGDGSEPPHRGTACGPYFELPHEEMYGEFFDIPAAG